MRILVKGTAILYFKELSYLLTLECVRFPVEVRNFLFSEASTRVLRLTKNPIQLVLLALSSGGVKAAGA